MLNISLIMPNMNGEKYLESALAGFGRQAYPKKHLYVIDGKSTDGSHDILSRFCEGRDDVTWIRESDAGISNAINMALDRIPDGDLTCYAGSDDILRAGVFEKAAALATEFPFCDAVYFNSYAYDGTSFAKAHQALGTISARTLRRHGTIVGFQNIFVRASVLKKLRMNESLRYAMDLDFYYRMIAAGHGRFLHCPEYATLNMIDGSISTAMARHSARERHLVTLRHGGFHLVTAIRFCWAHLATRFASKRS